MNNKSNVQMKIKFLIICFFFSLFSFAQYTWSSATIYLKGDDVLKGEAVIKQGGGFRMLPKESLKFRKNKKEKATKVEAEKVDSIVFTLEYQEKVNKKKVKKSRKAVYVTKFVEEKKKRLHFLELLVDGDIQLLGRTFGGGATMGFGPGTSTPTSAGNIPNAPMVKFYGGHNLKYLSNNSEMALRVYNTKEIAEYFKDCPNLSKKIKDEKLDDDHLGEILEYYSNNCN